MENLKDGLELSSHNEESSKLDKIGLGIGFLILIVFISSLLNGYFDSLDQSYFHFDDYFLGWIVRYMIKIIFVVVCLVFSLKLIMEGGRENPGVFYFKNSLIVLRNSEEGEIVIPLQMIKRILLHEKDSVIVKYNEGFLNELDLPRNTKISPLGEFIFKLNKKSIKIGPSLIDELNKKLQ
jgi:hypothetical protein